MPVGHYFCRDVYFFRASYLRFRIRNNFQEKKKLSDAVIKLLSSLIISKYMLHNSKKKSARVRNTL